MDARKKALIAQYKARTVVGGVYRVINRENGRFLLQSTDDIQSAHNMLAFSKQTGSCLLPHVREDWLKMGSGVFEIEELERLEKKEEQTSKQFQEDLEVLLEYWDEKFPRENRY